MKTIQEADDAWEDRYFQEQKKIAALPFEEARRQVELLLADPRKIECVAAASNFDLDPEAASSGSVPMQPGTRIVSKGQYVANTMNKVVLTTLGIAVFILGMVGIWFLCSFVLPILWSPDKFSVIDFLFCFSAIMLFGGLMTCLYAGKEAFKSGKAMDVGVPLTRTNTAHLPAADSLVRASQEPVHEQGNVLLRAAGWSQETLPEQLLRASEEGRKKA